MALKLNAGAVRKAVQVSAATVFAFGVYHISDLPQGYWAILTVLIVMQGSVGGTLGAAFDRLLGTLAGAVLGALALIIIPHEPLWTAIALTIVVGVSAYAAGVKPQLKAAPVAAAIVLLIHPPGISPTSLLVERVLEIALGGVIGVAASVLIFPARSRQVIAQSFVKVIATTEEVMRKQAAALAAGKPISLNSELTIIRNTLAQAEQAMADAERERASGLGGDSWSASLPRTLWRIRTDLSLIGRSIDASLSESSLGPLSSMLITQLEADAELAGRCRAALDTATAVDRSGIRLPHEELLQAVNAYGKAHVSEMAFNEIGQLFGLVFTMERLRRDLNDLADRIDEPLLKNA